jgi:cobalt-zinc-cadmium efflux system outer membrane protein
MRFKTLATAAAFVWFVSEALAQTTGTPTLTLDQAWQMAQSANPQIRARLAQVAAAAGAKTDARAWLNGNPQLTVEQTRRSVPQAGLGTDRRSEWSTGLSQTVEIGGQPSYRRESAAAALAALRSEIQDTRAQVRAEVADQFHRVLTLQQRVELEVKALTLFESTAEAVRKRRAAGEDTKLDANVALVEAERARNQLAQAQEQLLAARTRLAALLQLPPLDLPQASGDLGPARPAYTLDELLRVIDEQPRLQGLAARENGAAARLKLERASIYPDITVAMSVGREGPGDARERLTRLSLSVPLPLFKRNASGIGQATSDLSQTQIERQVAARDARSEVSGLWARLASLEARVQRLQSSVLPALEDNQQLAAKSQRAGQIGLLELIVVNRQGLDARRDLLDALTDYHATRIALERAAGWPQEGNKP